MSEDFGNVEAELEALMAALELVGVAADQARRQAVSLVQRMRQDAPRSRAEWDRRAQLVDANGQGLGWMDTRDTRRIDLNDRTGDKDRNLSRTSSPAREEAGQDSALMEADGQFFAVQPGQGLGDPERVRPISVEDAEAQLAQRRPELEVRRVEDGGPRLEVMPSSPVASAGVSERGGSQREPAGSGSLGVWDAPEAVRQGSGGGRTAAEAFGAAPVGARRERSAGTPESPSTAELTAVGATKLAEARMSR